MIAPTTAAGGDLVVESPSGNARAAFMYAALPPSSSRISSEPSEKSMTHREAAAAWCRVAMAALRRR